MPSLIQKLIRSQKATFTFLLAMLFFPLFFHGYHYGLLPWVKGGDEPHYLLIINSFLNDGDFDLRNNYDSALKGYDQAGYKFASKPLDRHIWFKGGKIGGPDVYEGPEKWILDAEQHPVPLMKKNIQEDFSNIPEYPAHPVGIAFLLAPILWFFRGGRFIEPLALFCSFAAVAGAAYLFHRLVRRFNPSLPAANTALLLTFLASPIWMNARTLFMEPYLLFFAVASYLCFIERKSGFWTGILLGLGGLLKPNFLILVLPPALYLLRERKWKEVLLLGIGPFLSALTFLCMNDLFFGSPFISPQPVTLGNPLHEAYYLLFSWNHGILMFSPIAVYCFFAWKKFHKAWGGEALLIGSGFILYFLFMVFCWAGPWGWSYGPRHVVPVLPFLMVPMALFWDDYGKFGKGLRWLSAAAIVVSVFINFLGALDGYWDSNPITILAGHIGP